MKSVIAEGLIKTYDKGSVRALDGLSLDVEEGTVLGVLGPNGAGKTTTVRILSTLLRPDSGHATELQPLQLPQLSFTFLRLSVSTPLIT